MSCQNLYFCLAGDNDNGTRCPNSVNDTDEAFSTGNNDNGEVCGYFGVSTGRHQLTGIIDIAKTRFVGVINTSEVSITYKCFRHQYGISRRYQWHCWGNLTPVNKHQRNTKSLEYLGGFSKKSKMTTVKYKNLE